VSKTNQPRELRATLIGRVVSAKMKDTIVVTEERLVKHALYGKYMRKNSKYYAHTYVRSQELSKRDSSEKLKFVVGTGDNNGFDKTLSNRSDGLPLHFYSPDLQKESDYSNQRQHFYRHYRSTLVVPICGENKGKEGTPDQFDRVGFLCVDTLSINRLNNGYHLYMLSALANQMYNFMSLMRGKYTVFVG